jgi:hypothetical protein
MASATIGSTASVSVYSGSPTRSGSGAIDSRRLRRTIPRMGCARSFALEDPAGTSGCGSGRRGINGLGEKRRGKQSPSLGVREACGVEAFRRRRRHAVPRTAPHYAARGRPRPFCLGRRNLPYLSPVAEVLPQGGQLLRLIIAVCQTHAPCVLSLCSLGDINFQSILNSG